MKKRFLAVGLFLLIVLMSFLSGCYYDKKEELFPVINSGCDTAVITYSGAVKTILANYCTSCHSEGLASGGVILSTYSGAQAAALNGKLLSSIKHLSGAQPMPPGTQIDDCKITVIEKWVNAEAPDN